MERQEHCPLCGSSKVFRQMMYYSPGTPDRNKRRCDDCGAEWRFVKMPGRPSDELGEPGV